MTQTERIEYMEAILNEGQCAVQELADALERYQSVKPRVDELEAYYTSRLWMQDYEDDCAGRLPQSLKRGVLSQDAVFDLLDGMREVEQALKEGL